MRFLRFRVLVFCTLIAVTINHAQTAPASARLNVLIITTDDMSCDSVGVYGCKLPDTTPHMDRLAAQSLRFNHAFVQVGNCMPSRNVMFSGRYPHNNHVEGFYEIKRPGYPVMADLMKAAGYFTGIRGKVAHSTPYTPYPGWDLILDTLPDGTAAHPKNVESYYLSTRHGIAAAKRAGKPFCFNLNISDPHKPFYNEDGQADVNRPSRVFTAAEVPVPGFLPDDPAIRQELALYYSSVRRGDDCLGQILRALQESGEDSRTAIIFLSDHGMPLPFAKTQLYFHSTRTPWMVRWPGVTQPGTVDDRHLVSAVDLLPTLLDLAGIPHPAGFDGRSFAPVLRGEIQAGRDFIVAEYNENSGGFRHPMRALITRDHGYLFNPWSNGQRIMATATKGTVSYRRMQALARTDAGVAARLQLFDTRVPEELYHYAKDPDALHNLIALPAHQATRDRLTRQLEAWMVQTKDPMLDVFRHRQDPAAREAYMQAVEAEAAERNGTRTKQGKGGRKKAGGAAAVEPP
ncbi:sulfatase family protein [Horticoccus sp. 23ND18S-11]|uniref:sulfatase family protein n=1 Tax=Horticoccus sp. 23ND18S-11 TaxID=3391832 RepID=UPI0039C91B0A